MHKKSNCGNCVFHRRQETAGGIVGTYGVCAPPGLGELPWWATTRVATMQTNTRDDEGVDCAAWQPEMT